MVDVLAIGCSLDAPRHRMETQMILHASFTVDDPRSAAETLAEILEGEAVPFPELGDDAWLSMSGDEHGTLVEFLQRGTEFHYVAGGTVAHRQGDKRRESGTHILIETPHDEARVLAIAAERGSQAHRANHGPLEVIEFWIERCLLIEVVTPQLAAKYRKLATPHNARAIAGARPDGPRP